ncbi:hypothetical protein [Victivallis sp. Marseille-Q1083]|uniref:hypothetical protein n=1 Tax=Victivallis sp. Marseille-Q1083 TaxID=2717288 RepID=UPI001C379512|nr:hypothetical protein [Victivallis sp. Marseille-Q1083]
MVGWHEIIAGFGRFGYIVLFIVLLGIQNAAPCLSGCRSTAMGRTRPAAPAALDRQEQAHRHHDKSSCRLCGTVREGAAAVYGWPAETLPPDGGPASRCPLAAPSSNRAVPAAIFQPDRSGLFLQNRTIRC